VIKQGPYTVAREGFKGHHRQAEGNTTRRITTFHRNLHPMSEEKGKRRAMEKGDRGGPSFRGGAGELKTELSHRGRLNFHRNTNIALRQLGGSLSL